MVIQNVLDIIPFVILPLSQQLKDKDIIPFAILSLSQQLKDKTLFHL